MRQFRFSINIRNVQTVSIMKIPRIQCVPEGLQLLEHLVLYLHNPVAKRCQEQLMALQTIYEQLFVLPEPLQPDHTADQYAAVVPIHRYATDLLVFDVSVYVPAILVTVARACSEMPIAFFNASNVATGNPSFMAAIISDRFSKRHPADVA